MGRCRNGERRRFSCTDRRWRAEVRSESTFRFCQGYLPHQNYIDGLLKPHQQCISNRTHSLKIQDHLGPVSLSLSPRSESRLAQVLAEIQALQPELAFSSTDAREHRIWQAPSQYNQILEKLIAQEKCLYILDGHHRLEGSASQLRLKESEDEDSNNYIMAIIYPSQFVRVQGQLRILKGVSWKQLKSVLGQYVIQATDKEEPEKSQIIVRSAGRKTLVTLPPRTNIKDSYEVVHVQNIINKLSPHSLRYSPQPHQPFLDQICLQYHGVGIEGLVLFADSGQSLPAKATWIQPKAVIHGVIRMREQEE